MEDIKQLKEKVKNLKLLFVDDEKEFRESTSLFLHKFFDNVVICVDGEDALNKFMQSKDFDILITDIMMPKMDGVTLVEKVKELKPDIFTVIVSASRGRYKIDESLYDIILQKPISFEDITMIMQKAVDSQ